MLMMTSDVIGYIAACLTTSAFVPQAWLTWQHKRAEGVSIGMYVIMVCGVLMWMIYGILLHAWPIIIANAVTMALAVFILVMRFIYK